MYRPQAQDREKRALPVCHEIESLEKHGKTLCTEMQKGVGVCTQTRSFVDARIGRKGGVDSVGTAKTRMGGIESPRFGRN